MEFNKIANVTGIGGLWFVASQRPDGLICKSLTDGKIQFIPSRKHQFTFLESITMYMQNNDTKPLLEILLNIKNEKIILPDTNKATGEELRNFFAVAEPNHDATLVHVSDIKKLIKWFITLEAHDAIKPKENNDTVAQSTTENSETAPTKVVKTKAEKTESSDTLTPEPTNEAPKKKTTKKAAAPSDVSETGEATPKKSSPRKKKDGE